MVMNYYWLRPAEFGNLLIKNSALLGTDPVGDSQVAVGADEEFEIGRDFLESKVSQGGIAIETIHVVGPTGFEGHCRIHTGFAACDAHHVEDRATVKLVIELVLVRKQQIRDERDIKLIVAEWEIWQAPVDVM